MKLVRPTLPDDRLKEIRESLLLAWERSVSARAQQVDQHLDNWDKLYRAEPKVKNRNHPFEGASNIVVPMIRMHKDTLQARLMGLIRGTRPLVGVEGYPREQVGPLEVYANWKALNRWGMLQLAESWCDSSLRTGTGVVKTTYVRETAWDISASDNDFAEHVETEVLTYEGPKSKVIPFEDLYVHPITATCKEEVEIWFCRHRFTEETARYKTMNGAWKVSWDDEYLGNGKYSSGLKKALAQPNDVKRTTEGAAAGVVDGEHKEIHAVECHLKLDIKNNGRMYDVVVLLCPAIREVLDLYYNPYPRNECCFDTFIPSPRSSLFYGESYPEILGPLQEEISTIHNDRRNNATLANMILLMQKKNSKVPNLLQLIKTGSILQVEAMDEVAPLQLGRNYNDMINEEQFAQNLMNQLSSVSAVAMGAGQGSMSKRGGYTAQGTMAVLSESNDRQSTILALFRESLAAVLKKSFVLQSYFGADDKDIEVMPEADREAVRQALQWAKRGSSRQMVHVCPWVIKTSTAAMNKEMRRQNLMQLYGVIQNHGTAAIGAAQQLMSPELNPAVKELMLENIRNMRQMARDLLAAFDELDPEGLLTNPEEILKRNGFLAENQGQPGAGQLPGIDREGIADLAALPVGEEEGAYA